MTQTQEHPSFKRARKLEGPFAGHFPTTPQEAADWDPVVRVRALASRVLVVAQTRVECAWAAYCDAVPGQNHAVEWEEVLRQGSKLEETTARNLFPSFKGVPYAR